MNISIPSSNTVRVLGYNIIKANLETITSEYLTEVSGKLSAGVDPLKRHAFVLIRVTGHILQRIKL